MNKVELQSSVESSMIICRKQKTKDLGSNPLNEINVSEEGLETLSHGRNVSSNDYYAIDKCRFLLELINSNPANCSDLVEVKSKAITKLSNLIGEL